jgi:hypothetical protein
LPDGSNRIVNSGESVRVSPGQYFFDAPSHKRGSTLKTNLPTGTRFQRSRRHA